MSLTGAEVIALMGGKVDGEWASTGYGALHHLVQGKRFLPRFGRDMQVTHCGRLAFDYVDHPISGHNGRGCEVCVRRAIRLA